MIRKVTENDKNIYLELTRKFYSSEAVLHKIPEQNFSATFNELMRSDVYAEAFIIEYNDQTAGYGLIAKTFSQEAGGLVIWLEELFILPEYRCLGLGKEFLDYLNNHILPGAARVRLEIESENSGAVRLYEKYGFTEFGYEQMIKQLR